MHNNLTVVIKKEYTYINHNTCISFLFFSKFSPNLKDEGRLMTLVMMEAANLSSSISGQGHSYAMTHCSSRMNAAAQLKEVLGGMAQVCIDMHVLLTFAF